MINKIIHGCLWIWNFPSRVPLHISLVHCATLEEKFHIYARSCIILYISPPETANQWDNGPLASMTMDQDFPGKVSHCRHSFLVISIAQWSVEEDDTILGKVAKAKEKPAAKKEKPENAGAEKQDNESTGRNTYSAIRNTLTAEVSSQAKVFFCSFKITIRSSLLDRMVTLPSVSP